MHHWFQRIIGRVGDGGSNGKKVVTESEKGKQKNLRSLH